jgi:uncharacterized protein (TIGR02594 family)
MSEPVWIIKARSYIGTREYGGSKHNSIILRWWRAIKSAIADDESPWCAAFVGGVLEECTIVSSRAANARSYLKWGARLSAPVVGCIVVFWRGDPKGWSGHVGFVVGKDKAGNLMVLGGNQGDAVNVKPFGRERVLGYVWPKGIPLPAIQTLPVLDSDGKLSSNEA